MSLVFLDGLTSHSMQCGLALGVVSSPGPELDAFGARHGVPTYAVPMRRRVTPARDVGAVWRIWRTIRRVRPEIVHAHTPKGGLLGMIAAAMARVPVRIYHMRGLPFTGARGARRLLLRATERTACRLAHRVICVSHSLREIAISEGLCPPHRITVLAGGSGQGVDATRRFVPEAHEEVRTATRARLGVPPSATVVGFVGRLVRDKGLVELEAAWRALRDERPELRLLLIGPWEPQDPVPAEVRERLETDPRVVLVGMEWDTPPLYAAMDIVALPTYREGFPNVPLEAAAMELPVVATRVPGCVDAVTDRLTGTLVPPRDSAALAAALRAYVDDPGLRRRHGTAGRARVLREFRQEVIWEATIEEYRRLLERGPLRGDRDMRGGSG